MIDETPRTIVFRTAYAPSAGDGGDCTRPHDRQRRAARARGGRRAAAAPGCTYPRGDGARRSGGGRTHTTTLRRAGKTYAETADGVIPESGPLLVVAHVTFEPDSVEEVEFKRDADGRPIAAEKKVRRRS